VKCLVTGVSGYFAGSLAHLLISKGHQVRGTVRSLNSKEKVEHLQKELSGIELVEADLLTDGSFDKAVEECEWIFHTACPFFTVPKEDPIKELVEPSLKGTLNVLKSAEKSGTVKRVVLTSSIAAVASFSKPVDYIYNESDWNLDGTIEKEPYRYSKRIAEEAAWEFSKNRKWDLVVINPGFILGPPLSSRDDSTSVKTMKVILDGTAFNAGVGGPYAFPPVDVRDVAEAHLRAAENPKASGRYILASSSVGITQLEYCQILQKSGKFDKYRIPNKEATPLLRRFRVDNSKVQRELGLKFRNIEESIVEMAVALIDLGIVKRIE